MSTIAIRAEGLGKRYTVGGGAPYLSLRETLAALPRRLLGGGGRRAGREELWALQDVSFEVKQGEVLGVIGRNGAGKSTLLKVLSRITRPTAGRAQVWGRVGSLLEVGTGFHPELTGRENIWLYGAILGLKRAEIQRKFDEIVAFSEVERFLDTPVKRYSSGMQMRLAFSVAAHLEPEVLLVDEVLAVGDAAFQRKCLGKMENVRRGGRTVVFVSHNLAAVERLCARAMWLESGRVAHMGETGTTVAAYLQRVSGDCVAWRRSTSPSSPAYFEEALLWGEKAGRPAVISTASTLAAQATLVLSRDLPSLELSVDLLDGVEQTLAVTTPADGGVTMPRRAGRHRLAVKFPPGVLLDRRYGLRLNLYIPGMGSVDRVEGLWFTVAAAASVATNVPLRREGHVYIPCRWWYVNDGEGPSPHTNLSPHE